MPAVAGLAMLAAGTTAVSCVPLTNVVASTWPFHSTLEPATNPVPLIVSVNPAPPGATDAGTVGWSIWGTGFAAENAAEQLKSARTAATRGIRARTLIAGTPFLFRTFAGHSDQSSAPHRALNSQLQQAKPKGESKSYRRFNLPII